MDILTAFQLTRGRWPTTGHRKQANYMNARILNETYQWTHGRTPRGTGSWAFAPSLKTDILSPDILWIHNAGYGEAKKKAAAHFGAQGRRTAHVLP